MKCPIDQTDLLMTERHGGVEIDYCPTCRGVWLDRGGELDKIIEMATPEVALTNPEPEQAPSRSAPPDPGLRDRRHDEPRYEDRRHEGRREDRYDDRYDDRKSSKRYKKKRRKSFLEEMFDVFD